MAEGPALALLIPAWSLRAALDLGCVPALPAMERWLWGVSQSGQSVSGDLSREVVVSLG